MADGLTAFQHFHDLHFYFQLFLDSNDLNAGLYDGEVTGRRRFGDSQVMHDMDDSLVAMIRLVVWWWFYG